MKETRRLKAPFDVSFMHKRIENNVDIFIIEMEGETMDVCKLLTSRELEL